MTETFDAIVVGGGGSGLAAAVSAAQAGSRVLLLEKQRHLGGTTGIAVGSFTAAGTRWQRSRGINDSASHHAADAGQFAAPEIENRNNAELRAFFLGHASETLDWLVSLGLAFVGPSPEPPNRVPRMHNVVPNAKAYIAALQTELVRLGGTILTGAAVTGLLRDDDRVAGVHVNVGPEARTFRAVRGVILAAGDYASAPDLISRSKGPGYDAIEGINPFACGDGQRLVETAGGQLLNMEVTYGPELRFIAPARPGFQSWLPATPWMARAMATAAPFVPAWLMRIYIKRLLVTWQHPENALFDDGAILVNNRGQRFCNERTWPDRELAVAQQSQKVAYLVLDGKLVERYSAWPHFISTAPDIAYAYVADYLRLRPDVAVQANCIEAVAAKRGIDPQLLRSTIDAHNRDGSSETGARPRLPLDRPPWVLLGPAKAYFTTTEGGAAIDHRFRVLRPNGKPIPGLFAVGQNGLGGMILWGHGLHMAWALTSGRLAGQIVARDHE